MANVHPVMADILPTVHALTGCDSVSSLYGIGKKSAMKVLEGDDCVAFETLSKIGSVARQFEDIARPYFSQLYDSKRQFVKYHGSLNKLRTAMSAKKEISLAKLPPCEDAFKFHMKRAAYQCKIWINADNANRVTDTLLESGWEEHVTGLSPIYYESEMAADLLSKLYCSCSSKKPCSSEDCSCKINSLSCIELCACSDGENCFNKQTSLNN